MSTVECNGQRWLQQRSHCAARPCRRDLDFNGNGLIETRAILNLGGNGGTEAGLQRNNVQWLDANGDGVLDKRDPAFEAIKLWVDVNQDGQMQAGEGQSLAVLQHMQVAANNDYVRRVA